MFAHLRFIVAAAAITLLSSFNQRPTLTDANCISNISSVPDLSTYHLNGSWFVIARKGPAVDYLPKGINSSLIRLIADGSDLVMEEYHSINGSCMPTVHGRWVKQSSNDGYSMEVRNPTGSAFQIFIRVIFHTFSGEQNEEMNMVLYGCRVITNEHKCTKGEELTSILSNSRHPQTLALFQSAKHIEDNACIDVLEMVTLNTYNSCGDEVVDEDQKLRHALIDEDSTFVDVECKVENWKGFVDITKLFDEPRVLTVVAYIDPVLDNEQIAHISCHYSSQTAAECEWIRQRKCFKTKLTQSFDGKNRLRISTQFPLMNGSTVDADLAGSVIWQNGDEYVTLECLHVEEDDGSCETYRVYVWSDEDHMDQPTLREIYNVLHAFCIDPTELNFLNTFHECHDKSNEANEIECSPPPGWSPVAVNILQGSWYFAADVNDKPKILINSAVIQLIPSEDDKSLMHLTFYAQTDKGDRECIGPGNGTVRLLNDSTLEIAIEHRYKLVPRYRNTISWNSTIIYLDNQRMILYRCLDVAENGTCVHEDLDFLVRSRYVSPNDVSLVLPYLERACVPKTRLRWFDLHSSCGGTDVIASTRLRRDMVTMSHSQVLDILTNVQEPRCVYDEVRGVRVDLDTMEKAGVWYMISVFDNLPHDTYALILRVIKVSEDTAVMRMKQAAAIPHQDTFCYTLVFGVQGRERSNAKGEADWVYEMVHLNEKNQSSTMLVRFLFFNNHTGAIYSCYKWLANGTCGEAGIYVISRHISIDHAELAVLETTFKAVCMQPQKLFHTGTHDECVMDPTKVKLPACAVIDKVNEESFTKASVDDLFWTNSNATADDVWENAVNSEYGSSATAWPTLENDSLLDYGVYYAIASDKPDAKLVAIMKNGTEFVKIFETNSGCGYATVEVRTLTNFPAVALVGSQLLLLSRHPYPPNAELLRRKGQRSAPMPCLTLIDRVPSKCAVLNPPQCTASTPIRMAEQLHGEWQLYSSDPYVSLNTRCIVSSSSMDEFLFNCLSESYNGDCEREVLSRIRADAWGGYTRLSARRPDNADKDKDNHEIPVRVRSEIFDRGNITVTDNYLLLISEDTLIGRRYSLWLRAGGTTAAQKAAAPRPLTRRDARVIAQACVWPRQAHLRNREQNCL